VNNFFVDGSCVIKGEEGGCIFFVLALFLRDKGDIFFPSLFSWNKKTRTGLS